MPSSRDPLSPNHPFCHMAVPALMFHGIMMRRTRDHIQNGHLVDERVEAEQFKARAKGAPGIRVLCASEYDPEKEGSRPIIVFNPGNTPAQYIAARDWGINPRGYQTTRIIRTLNERVQFVAETPSGAWQLAESIFNFLVMDLDIVSQQFGSRARVGGVVEPTNQEEQRLHAGAVIPIQFSWSQLLQKQEVGLELAAFDITLTDERSGLSGRMEN